VMRTARRWRQVLLATVNEAGEFSFIPVQDCRLTDETVVSIKAWTDIPPIETRQGEVKLALLIWDAQEGRAYQIAGHAVRSQETAVLNGYAEVEEHEHFPQTQREIVMEVDSITDLRFGVRESWQA
jgi:hypothetical protein